jgi:hypothetical protein
MIFDVENRIGKDVLIIADAVTIKYNCECGECHDAGTKCNICHSVVKTVILCSNVSEVSRGTIEPNCFYHN